MGSSVKLVRPNGVTFTSDTLIDVNDYTYDGDDIVVDGCTLTVNGEHQFDSLQVINGRVVTHSAAAYGGKHLFSCSQVLPYFSRIPTRIVYNVAIQIWANFIKVESEKEMKSFISQLSLVPKSVLLRSQCAVKI